MGLLRLLAVVGLVGAGVGHAVRVADGVELELALLELLGLEASLDGLDVLVRALDEAGVEGLDDGLLELLIGRG